MFRLMDACSMQLKGDSDTDECSVVGSNVAYCHLWRQYLQLLPAEPLSCTIMTEGLDHSLIVF